MTHAKAGELAGARAAVRRRLDEAGWTDEEETRPLMVGENPSRSGDRYWRFPLSGAPARVYCEAAGWAPDGPASEPGSWTWALYDRFRTANLFPRWRDVEKGWDVAVAWRHAMRLIEQEPVGGTIVAVGSRVAQAFARAVGQPVPERYEPRVMHDRHVWHLPHPSGRNRLLNEPEEVARLGAMLRRIAEGSHAA